MHASNKYRLILICTIFNLFGIYLVLNNKSDNYQGSSPSAQFRWRSRAGSNNYSFRLLINQHHARDEFRCLAS